ncbi:MAG: hypothetical protein U1E17_16010 [Geminicoccaceae bacterium]
MERDQAGEAGGEPELEQPGRQVGRHAETARHQPQQEDDRTPGKAHAPDLPPGGPQQARPVEVEGTEQVELHQGGTDDDEMALGTGVVRWQDGEPGQDHDGEIGKAQEQGDEAQGRGPPGRLCLGHRGCRCACWLDHPRPTQR